MSVRLYNKHMNVLFLDIASHNGIVACCTEDKILASEQCDTRISDNELVPLIEKVLKDSGLSYDQLTHVACITGPGGFTSLRVAVSCANTIADQIKIPSAGVHMSDYYKARTEESDVLWLHSTKKNVLFMRGGKWKESTHIELDKFLKEAPKKAKWMGELIEEHKLEIERLDFEEVILTDTENVLPEFLSSLQYKSELLEPWYGRNG